MPWCASATAPSTCRCLRTYRRTPRLSPNTPYRGECHHSVRQCVLPGHLHIVYVVYIIAQLIAWSLVSSFAATSKQKWLQYCTSPCSTQRKQPGRCAATTRNLSWLAQRHCNKAEGFRTHHLYLRVKAQHARQEGLQTLELKSASCLLSSGAPCWFQKCWCKDLLSTQHPHWTLQYQSTLTLQGRIHPTWSKVVSISPCL